MCTATSSTSHFVVELITHYHALWSLATTSQQSARPISCFDVEASPPEGSNPPQTGDMTVKQLCMNLHFFHGLVSAMNIILGHYNLIILLELMVWMATLRV